MATVTLANLFAIFITFIGKSKKEEKLYFLLGILFLIMFYGIRTNYGNDFPAYLEMFNDFSNCKFEYLLSYKEEIEPGWKYLNIILIPFGFQSLIIIHTVILLGTIYWLITKYCSPKYYWIIFAFYILNANMFMTSLSMMRQALAMSVCAWAIPYILSKKYIPSILFILLASTFHTSALICLSLLILPLLLNLKKWILIGGFLALYVIFTMSSSMVDDTLILILDNDEMRAYARYDRNEVSSGSGLGVMLYIVTCVWMLYKNSSRNLLFFTLIYAVTVSITPFALRIMLISRLQMYFNLMSFPAWQQFLNYRKDPIGFSLFAVNFLLILKEYSSFFSNPVWIKAFSVYHTILE